MNNELKLRIIRDVLNPIGELLPTRGSRFLTHLYRQLQQGLDEEIAKLSAQGSENGTQPKPPPGASPD